MSRLPIILLLALGILTNAEAQTMTLSISSDSFQVTPVFSDVGSFDIEIEIDAPLAAGNYMNPDIVRVSYSVTGSLVAGTPSGFPSFALQRDIAGTEFYAQGSSLNFEIEPSALLTDGVQADELVGNGVVFTFNGREVGNGRFHPALFELNSDGTGRIQNSDNVIAENPLEQVDFGEEYITDLLFDPGNTTLISETVVVTGPAPGGGSGALSPAAVSLLLSLIAAAVALRTRRRL